MNTTLLQVIAAVLGGLAWSGCRHVEPQPITEQDMAPAIVQPAGETYTGNISAIDPDNGLIKLKILLKTKRFQVDGDTQILSAKGPHSSLKDLKVGDPVDVLYTPGEATPLARRITVKGVTEDDREEGRERERMEQILTPTPSERESK